MKKGFVVLFVLLLTCVCASCLAEGTLRVGMECNYAPFNWTQASPSDTAVPIEGGIGYADGYDVQIAKKIAESLGKELVIVKCEWDGLTMGVSTGSFDLIIAGMSPTAERKLTIDFSDNYYTSRLVVVVNADSLYADATSLVDLSGAAITGQLNTFHYSVIDQIPGVNRMMAMNTFPEMIVALKSGVIDGYIAEEPGAVSDCFANPEFAYIRFDDGQGFAASDDDVSIAVGMAQGSELMDGVNEALSAISEEERLQMMLDATARQPLMSE